MFIIYDIFYLILSVFYFPYLLLKGKWHKDFPMRFGFLPRDIKERLSQKENIWIHAVSVGEVLSVKKLIHNLKTVFPTHQIVLSTVTKTGYEIAVKDTPIADITIYAPLDFSFIIRKMVNLIKPKAYIVAETEFWPNLLTSLHKRKVPIIQVNGRISDKSFHGYRKFSFIFRNVINYVNVFCMQSDLDKERIIELGADKKKVKVVGNINFDDLPNNQERRRCFEIEKDIMLFVAGSTHPGEEEIILKIFKSILNEFPNLRLILAPRHVNRAEEVLKTVAQYGFDPIRFSNIKDKKFEEGHVIVIDTMGNLKSIYSMATLVFIGKSLCIGGGHNIIEPAFFAKPILIGPMMENFRDITDIFLKKQAVIQVKNSDEMSLKIGELLKNNEVMKKTGQLAEEVIYKNTGATKRTTEIISEALTSI